MQAKSRRFCHEPKQQARETSFGRHEWGRTVVVNDATFASWAEKEVLSAAATALAAARLNRQVSKAPWATASGFRWPRIGGDNTLESARRAGFDTSSPWSRSGTQHG